MISLSNRYGIDSNILLRKVIEYLHIKSHTKEQILEKLEHYKLINDRSQKLLETIDAVISTSSNSLDDINVSQLVSLSRAYISKSSPNDHSGYPLPDPIKGRPHLQWCECYYEGCHTRYSSAEQLKNHLLQLGNLKAGFHQWHENAIQDLWLTPEKVMQSNMTKCPSYVCDKSHHLFTPAELCEHFRELGLPPFWHPGDPIKSKSASKSLVGNLSKVYMGEECIICSEKRPSALLLPCNHCVICIGCYKPMNKCPMCRQTISGALPI